MFKRPITNFLKNKRLFSCSYSYDKPMFSPFIANIMTGSIFTSIILSRIHSNDTQLMTKIYELEKEIKQLKSPKV